MRALLWLLLLAAAFALATIGVGWWAVPFVGLLGGFVVPRSLRPVLLVSGGAGLAWLALLLRSARADGFGGLVARLEQLLPVPVVALYAVTLLFPMLVAAGAALVATALTARRSGVEPGRDA